MLPLPFLRRPLPASSLQAGFTLIELLMVIAIMGILLILVATNLNTAQSRARDAKRRGDIKGIQNAFEQYYSINGEYDDVCANMGTTEYLPLGTGTDPLTGQNYMDVGSCQSDTNAYCVCASLEIPQGNATDAPVTTSCAYATSGDRDWYCLSSLQ